jgi:aryl-alcohol dehydrogenase-like predicted oxidoreductase
MQYRELGNSGVKVSAISMGCWPIVGDAIWGPQDKNDAIAALRAAVDGGINFFDSAEAYGNGYSEDLIGEGLSDLRSKVIIASKVSPSHHAPADLRASCEASLKRLRTDYIDIYYLHWPNHEIPFADTIGEMQRLRQEGKIRMIAASNYGVVDLPELLALEHVAVNELPYNLIFRAIEHEIMPICLKNKVSVTAYMPLMQGLLAGKYRTVADVPDARARTRHFSAQRNPQSRHGGPGAEEETFAAIAAIARICDDAGMKMSDVALAWVLHQKGIGSVIVGVRNPTQVQANVAAANLRLPRSMLAALDAATQPLKQKLGVNPDMWQSTENSRYR